MDQAWDPTRGRQVIAEAAVHLVATHGLEGVSVRKVATQAGVSAGLVQHHFPTKQALLLAAMHQVDAAVQARLEPLVSDRRSASARLRALALEILPLDETRATEARVWLAFIAAAPADPAITQAHAATWQELAEILTRLLTHHHGSDQPELDRATLLLAGLDGLAVTALAEPQRLPPPRLLALAEQLIGQALSPDS
ncbi:hypothetical protein Kisp01_06270 [Kineosporia sp. NBRC 101677]|uniref:TetR/AcrR family transcriptional regulator n=1 Tax=Kineosporia sp. NBRC 101677 TaxID=3032197 RepID=UPI0024A2FD82|nr:TetR/AcrR family transcriptional regulator [Kineosporia sp. NBRC 101677]GLY13611.1 hypothetical protein Kisp01_06270 [Kineosporia sp. NBRC 101677]